LNVLYSVISLFFPFFLPVFVACDAPRYQRQVDNSLCNQRQIVWLLPSHTPVHTTKLPQRRLAVRSSGVGFACGFCAANSK
jgi:hypothetical protein